MGKSVAELTAQLTRRPGLLEASSFPDRHAAERAVQAAVVAAPELAAFVEQELGLARLNVTMPEPIGVVVRAGKPPLECPHAVVLANGSHGRITIRTAYITAHDHTLAARHPELALLLAEYGQDYFDDHNDEAGAFLSTLFSAPLGHRADALRQLDEVAAAASTDEELTESLQGLGLAITLDGGLTPARSFVERTRVRLSTVLPQE